MRQSYKHADSALVGLMIIAALASARVARADVIFCEDFDPPPANLLERYMPLGASQEPTVVDGRLEVRTEGEAGGGIRINFDLPCQDNECCLPGDTFDAAKCHLITISTLGASRGSFLRWKWQVCDRDRPAQEFTLLESDWTETEGTFPCTAEGGGAGFGGSYITFQTTKISQTNPTPVSEILNNPILQLYLVSSTFDRRPLAGGSGNDEEVQLELVTSTPGVLKLFPWRDPPPTKTIAIEIETDLDVFWIDEVKLIDEHVDRCESSPPPLDLSDVIAGGNGNGTAPTANTGISADSGQFQTQLRTINVSPTAPNPLSVTNSNYIDSVFVIDRGAGMPINSSGVRFDFPGADAIGRTFGDIIRNRTHDFANGVDPTIWIGGHNTWQKAIAVHAAAGVTFNLEELWSAPHPERVLFFQSFVGMDQCRGSVNAWIIASDDQGVIASWPPCGAEPLGQNGGELVQFRIPGPAKYLTLAVGAADGATECDHGVFGDPIIGCTLSFPPERRVSVTCPPTDGDSVEMSVRRVLAEDIDLATRVSVSDIVIGDVRCVGENLDPAADEICSIDAGPRVADYRASGFSHAEFVNAWWILGPYCPADTSLPFSATTIQRDYLTDGRSVREATVDPVDGVVNTDFGGAAASSGIYVDGLCDSASLPTWRLRVDRDDTIDLDEINGTAIDSAMLYALTFVEVLHPRNLYLGLAWDDMIQVKINSVLPGNPFSRQFLLDELSTAGPHDSVARTVPLGDVGPGLYRVLVKLFDVDGPSAFRLRFQDADGSPVGAGDLRVRCSAHDDSCSLPVIGKQFTWDTTLLALANGLEYQILSDPGQQLDFVGDVRMGASITPTVGRARYDVPAAPANIGPLRDPPFDHVHTIGAPCPEIGARSDGGRLVMTGGGSRFGEGDDDLLFAYSERLGNFDASVELGPGETDDIPRGQAGILVREDCGPRSRSVFVYYDTDRGRVTAANRSDHDVGDVEFREGSPGLLPDSVRLTRLGNLFIAYGRIPAGDWTEFARFSWGASAPEGLLLGVALTSGEGCAPTQASFAGWRSDDSDDSGDRTSELFVRGDVNLDDQVDLADAISGLNFTFRDSPAPRCSDGADMNDDGNVDLGDWVSILSYVCLGGSTPPPPSPSGINYSAGDCGPDPTLDDLGCATSAPLCS